MKRLNLFVILAFILASCGSAPTGHDWCYVYDLSNPVNSVGTAISIYDGTLVATGIQSVGGQLNLEMGSEPNNVGQPQPLKFAMTVYNPGAPFSVNWGVYAFRSDWGNIETIPSGRSTLYGNPTTASTTDGYASASITAGASDVLIVENATVYGTGTNPYPRNDCAPIPTNTPAPPPATATPSPTNTASPGATNTPILGGDELNIPITSAFTSLNDWIALLAPVILMVGMIPVALGALAWIASKIRDGFGGG